MDFGRLALIFAGLTILGLLSRAIFGNSTLGGAALMPTRKKCNQCLSWVNQEARKCKNCGSDV